jgi:hypothetical protein
MKRAVVDVQEVWVSEMHVRGMPITEKLVQSAVIPDYLSEVMVRTSDNR